MTSNPNPSPELREAAQEAHDTLHECTAVLTANDCAKVAATMSRLRAALATPEVSTDALADTAWDARVKINENLSSFVASDIQQPGTLSLVRPAAQSVQVRHDVTADLRKVFRDAARGYGRAGTADLPGGPDMSMDDAADVYASLAALSQTLPAPGEVDYAEAARVMFEACRDRFMRAEQCYPAIDALAAAGFFATVAAANDEGVARIIDPYAWKARESDLASADKWHKKADAYAVDTDPNIFPLGQQALDNIVSQWHGLADRFAKSAGDRVKPSLAKAAAIRLLSQGGGKA